MKISLAGRTAALGLALAGSLALASPLRADEAASGDTLAPGTHGFTTTFSPTRVGGGSFVGVLQLQVAKDGSISGFFRDTSVGDFHQIAGGVRGSHVWLDLGTIGDGRPFDATYRDGKIEGGVFSNGQPYAFLATPSQAISGDAGAYTPTSPRAHR